MIHDRNLNTILLALALLALPTATQALESPSYSIPQFSFLNLGARASSTNYRALNASGPIVGVASSTNFDLDTGFPAVTGSVINLVLNDDSVGLGTLSPGTPRDGSTSLTVTTDSPAGYTLAIEKEHLLLNADGVATIPDWTGTIATPTNYTGTGLGFSVSAGTSLAAKWGSGTKFAAIPTGNPIVFHSLVQSINAPDQTTVTYKLDIPSAPTVAGSYETTVSFWALALP